MSIFSFSLFGFFPECHNRLFYTEKDFCFSAIFCFGAPIFYYIIIFFICIFKLSGLCVCYTKKEYNFSWLANFPKLFID